MGAALGLLAGGLQPASVWRGYWAWGWPGLGSILVSGGVGFISSFTPKPAELRGRSALLGRLLSIPAVFRSVAKTPSRLGEQLCFLPEHSQGFNGSGRIRGRGYDMLRR